MELRGVKKAAMGLAASTAMVAGAVMAGTGTAAAAEAYQGPELSVDQGDFDGKNLELTLTNPMKAQGLFSDTACTSALLDGAQGLEAFVAYNDRDFGKLVSIMASPGLRLGPAAANHLLDPGPNTASRTLQVDNGVYIYLGTCGGWNSALDPGNVGISLVPVIVPDGLGSLSPALDFGSTALEAGADLTGLLPLLGSLAEAGAS